MPQQQGFYDHFSARAFLLYMAELKGIAKKQAKTEVDRMLSMVNLTHVVHAKIGSFSGGMKQRVLLAQALLGDPEILILDEPTAGLDPKERIHIRNFISELSKNKIILYATHVVSDIECIAEQVMLFSKGRLVRMGTPVELIASLEGKVAELLCKKEELNQLQKEYKFANVSQKKDGLALRIVGDDMPEDYLPVYDNINLEDVYLYYLEYLQTESHCT
jgi:ABC-type multidrug transport system ATPase subunit